MTVLLNSLYMSVRYLFSEEWASGKAIQVQQRLAADFSGWETSHHKFEEQIENVIRALWADDGACKAPPLPKIQSSGCVEYLALCQPGIRVPRPCDRPTRSASSARDAKLCHCQLWV